MKVGQCMSGNLLLGNPDQSLQTAARCMFENNTDFLPVSENYRLVGIVTNRDLAVRAIARGLVPQSSLREAMSANPCCCLEDEEIEDVIAKMASRQFRRMPVLNGDKRLIGVVSLSDMTAEESQAATGDVLRELTHARGHPQTRGSIVPAYPEWQ